MRRSQYCAPMSIRQLRRLDELPKEFTTKFVVEKVMPDYGWYHALVKAKILGLVERIGPDWRRVDA